MRNKASKYDSLMKIISRQRYIRSHVGNRLFGTATYLVPQANNNGFATITPMIFVAVLANSGMKCSTGNIVDSLPENYLLGDMVIQNAADTIILTKESIKKAPMYLCHMVRETRKAITTLQNTYAGIVCNMNESRYF